MSEFLLDDTDLAYMREEQTLVRPTACLLTPRASQTSDGRGGTRDVAGTPVPIQARITHLASRNFRKDVPQDLADRFGISVLVRLHLDLAPIVQPGDVLQEETTLRKYDVVSSGAVADAWTTAQIAWGVAK